MNERNLSPEHHKMYLIKNGTHQFLVFYTRGGRYLGILDFDFSLSDLGDWSRLFALGALTPGDLL